MMELLMELLTVSDVPEQSQLTTVNVYQLSTVNVKAMNGMEKHTPKVVLNLTSLVLMA